MKRLAPVFLSLFVLSASPVAAQSCRVSYAEFEDNVPHIDTDACPNQILPADESFCRLAIIGAEVFVYHFRLGEESCLTAVETYPINAFVERFGATYSTE